LILSQELIDKLNKLGFINHSATVDTIIEILSYHTKPRLYLKESKYLMGIYSKRDFDRLIKIPPFKVYTCVIDGRRYLRADEVFKIFKAYREYLTTQASMG